MRLAGSLTRNSIEIAVFYRSQDNALHFEGGAEMRLAHEYHENP